MAAPNQGCLEGQAALRHLSQRLLAGMAAAPRAGLRSSTQLHWLSLLGGSSLDSLG